MIFNIALGDVGVLFGSEYFWDRKVVLSLFIDILWFDCLKKSSPLSSNDQTRC